MMTIRREVQTFASLTETLLSPVLLGRALLNEDEYGLITLCIQNLAKRFHVNEVHRSGSVDKRSQSARPIAHDQTTQSR